MTDAFKPGDLVQLKSGGPVMTIDLITERGAWAIWFAYGKHRRLHFAAPALQAAEAPRPVGARGAKRRVIAAV